ncbi:hypothetical protein CONCODRAFT_68510 [Conidiobolus coronatus NRRL 28638]|uniref:Calcium-dependent phosphotriesterase n=1 Tax=Conidiobolus coronatus (strain ATCC 28846 / CBS 209.66 / NRRL 28638) TaxID=796925 RepID=A0A137PDS1_CONC2|nr:hypothetical protein CONCODRAFT_68510 [Conidiobolus coronatus NRRL 28638]|eukprot:KXN73081.1 hypothetical protein CONCODRAFT_68510 [Conidiobolus coronatus NRRL 28638]
MKKTVISPINILLVAILSFCVYNYYQTKIAPLFNISPISNELASDRCEVIKGPTGCEDIIIPSGASFGILACGPDVLYKKTWGSSGYRNLAKNPIKQKVLDKLYHFDLKTSELVDIPIKNLPNGYTLDLHGFDMIADPKEKDKFLLYAVNHMRNSSEIVDKFYYNSAKKELKWFGAEHGKLKFLVNPNGLAFVDSNNYLVTSHSRYESELLFKLQFLGLVNGGAVSHFGPSNISIIADSIPFANGVVPSKDGKLLFVASTLGLYINVYKITKQENEGLEFKYLDKISVDVMPDNLNLDSETGDIFVTGVINPIELITYLAVPGLPKKEQNVAFRIVRVKIENISENTDKYEFNTETVLEHDGSIHRMATVAAPHYKLNRVLIGFLFTDEVLNCKLNI